MLPIRRILQNEQLPSCTIFGRDAEPVVALPATLPPIPGICLVWWFACISLISAIHLRTGAATGQFCATPNYVQNPRFQNKGAGAELIELRHSLGK